MRKLEYHQHSILPGLFMSCNFAAISGTIFHFPTDVKDWIDTNFLSSWFLNFFYVHQKQKIATEIWENCWNKQVSRVLDTGKADERG